MFLAQADGMSLRYRHFLKLLDFTPTELLGLLSTASTLKQLRRCAQERTSMSEKEVALLFEAPDQTTRWTAELACAQVGLRGFFMEGAYSGLSADDNPTCSGHRLGRLFDGLLLHGQPQERVEELARSVGLPVMNLGNANFQPIAVLADLLTMSEASSRPLSELSLTYLGDGTSGLAQSLMVGGAKLGMDIRFCGPKDLQPEETLTETCLALGAETGAQIRLYTDPEQAVKGSDFLVTHSWTNEPAKLQKKSVKAMMPYRLTSELYSQVGNSRCQLLHHLPVNLCDDSEATRELCGKLGVHGLEMSVDLTESALNLSYDQVENRLHCSKAVLVSLFH